VDKVLTVRAILHVFVEPGKIEDVEEALARIPEIIDVYEVTGEYDPIATAKANENVWSEGSNYIRRSPHL
jgi:DNA-binding Lrp family transcriptional regulator